MAGGAGGKGPIGVVAQTPPYARPVEEAGVETPHNKAPSGPVAVAKGGPVETWAPRGGGVRPSMAIHGGAGAAVNRFLTMGVAGTSGEWISGGKAGSSPAHQSPPIVGVLFQTTTKKQSVELKINMIIEKNQFFTFGSSQEEKKRGKREKTPAKGDSYSIVFVDRKTEPLQVKTN